MSKLPEHITRDLAAKLAEDVSDRVQMAISLTDDPADAMVLAVHATAVALGWAVAATADMARRAGGDESHETAADTLWEIMRPMVLRSSAALKARAS